ncbi:MAG: DNA recombination protein RmuC [Polyangia bacterium]
MSAAVSSWFVAACAVITLLAVGVLVFLKGRAVGRRESVGQAAGQQATALAAQRHELELAHQRERAQLVEQHAGQQALWAAQREAAVRDARHFADRCDALCDELHELRERLQQANEERARLDARLDEELRARQQERGLFDQKLEQSHKDLGHKLSELAQRLLSEKSDELTRSSHRLVEGTLSPLREQLGEFRRRVDEVYDKERLERFALQKEVQQLQGLNRTLSEQALSLTRALQGSSKARGIWGEVVLERVLSASGLRKGHEYATQRALTDETGRLRQPDVVVNLPDGRHLVIDSKVSLVDYERYCAAGDEATRQQALRAHTASVRGHLTQLAAKGYQGLQGLHAPDFVFMFVPIEAAYLAAFEADEALLEDSYARRVAIVGPASLLATLRAVESLWRIERQSRNTEEIARLGGGLVDQITRVHEALVELGGRIEQAQGSYREAMGRLSTGRGNLLRRAQELGKKGARHRRPLPPVEPEPQTGETGEPGDPDLRDEADPEAGGASEAASGEVAVHTRPPAGLGAGTGG